MPDTERKRRDKLRGYVSPAGLYVPFETVLSTPQELANHLGTVEERIMDLHLRVGDNSTDLKNIAGEVEQLVQVRVRDKRESGTGVASLSATGGSTAALAAAAALRPATPATVPPATLPPVAPSTDVHRVPYTGTANLVINPFLATLGWVIAFESGHPNSDESGLIRLINNSGAPFNFGAPRDLFTLTYGTAYAHRPFVSAYPEIDPTVVGGPPGFGAINIKSGGTAAGFIAQGIFPTGVDVPDDGIITIHYSVRSSVGG